MFYEYINLLNSNNILIPIESQTYNIYYLSNSDFEKKKNYEKLLDQNFYNRLIPLNYNKIYSLHIILSIT